MMYEVQRVKATGQIIDIRAKGTAVRPWGAGDKIHPFEIVEMDLSLLEMDPIFKTAVANGGDGYKPKEDPLLFERQDDMVTWIKNAPKELQDKVLAAIGVKP